jgi:NAD(P)-dependent dehydrogenase (short-subunit alcohol dehydrogenase family)
LRAKAYLYVGIGFEFVKLLNAKNCSVVIGDLHLTPAAQEYVSNTSEVQNGSSRKVLFKKTDVTVWKELEDLFAYTEKELGVPDIVCPGAGIFEPVGLLFHTTC